MPRSRILRLSLENARDEPAEQLGRARVRAAVDRLQVEHMAAWIPMLTPVHPIFSGRSTLASVETERCRPELPPEDPLTAKSGGELAPGCQPRHFRLCEAAR